MTAPLPPIRPARPEDEAAIVALWQACGLTTAYNDPLRDLRFAMAGPASCVLVAADAAPIGTVMVGHDGHRGWLYYVATAPAWRRRGLGRALIAAGEAWLAAQGVPKVQLMIRPNNAAVAGFYAALGYEDTPRRIMARWLAPAGEPQGSDEAAPHASNP
ncbi:GNAT family acetyltransferase [Sphingomonas morindae]|uniref:GNAT family acetyltransferase n=1 Tax=Sphingomonas morindae TaxID=1541170 RepID=A0ABY4X5G4_9SPHN|nr:GNAT family acetyltransferase [Sphingomonas morindae]USI72095.1 GNAT family acetyltransferase [Sphingomonas morindae]